MAARPYTPPTPVPLARAAATVETTIQMAAARGIQQARIALQPESLGSIEIHLRATAEGLVARVIASAPQAAQTLQAAASELRRSLEQQGVNLLNLDIGHPDGESGAGAASGEHGHESAAGSSEGDPSNGDGGGETGASSGTLRLPDGVLVDVLA